MVKQKITKKELEESKPCAIHLLNAEHTGCSVCGMPYNVVQERQEAAIEE